MPVPSRLVIVALLGLGSAGHLRAQVADSLPRRLTLPGAECDSLQPAASDSVYDAEAVDHPVQGQHLPIESMPFRAREVLTGRSLFRFVVEASGRIDPCSIELLEETTPAWTAAVLRELRHARYEPARRAGQRVRQRVYQVFTYHQDGRRVRGR